MVLSYICNRKHTYCNIDTLNKFSIILPFKNFVIVPQTYKTMNIVPRNFLQSFNTIDMYKNDSIITCPSVILYFANTLKNIYLVNCCTEFQSTFFQNKDVSF